MKEFLHAMVMVAMTVTMTTIIFVLAGAAFMTDACKLSNTGDLPSTLRGAFGCGIEGTMEVFGIIWYAAPVVFSLYLIQVFLMDAIYGVEYTDAKLSRSEEKADEKNSKE